MASFYFSGFLVFISASSIRFASSHPCPFPPRRFLSPPNYSRQLQDTTPHFDSGFFLILSAFFPARFENPLPYPPTRSATSPSLAAFFPTNLVNSSSSSLCHTR